MELVSVVIPVYNVEKYLGECIESVEKQEYKNIEVIIIDDGSTDASLKIANKYKEKYTNIKVYTKKNGGISSARNYGLKYANGKYIYFMDSDDIADKKIVEKLVNSIEKNNSDLACCGYSYFYKDRKEVADFPDNEILTSNEAKKCILVKDSMKGVVWNKLFKKSLIEKYNLFFNEEINIGEDVEFVMLYLNEIKKVSLVCESLYYYRMRKSSLLNYQNENDLTIFDVINKITGIDKNLYNEIIDYYALMYFKYYRLLKKTGKIKEVKKLSLIKTVFNKKISRKTKKYIMAYYILPEKVKLKIKRKTKARLF